MKLSLSIQTPEVEPILPLALLTGSFQEKCQKAATFGADGVELITTKPDLLDQKIISDVLKSNHLLPAAIASGAMSSIMGLTLLNADEEIAEQAYQKLLSLIDFAAAVGAPTVTIGSFRGRITGEYKDAESRFARMLSEAGEYARKSLTRIAIEPLNRYESNFIHNTREGLDFLELVDHPSVGLLIDTYHANIEESSRTQPFVDASKAGKLFHVHIADNNRLPPGLGLIEFDKVINVLEKLGYTGFISAELLPKPDPDTAAQLTMKHMLGLIRNLT